jgi:hypothetical protein
MEKIDSGNFELKPAPYSFHEFVQMINTMIKPLCKSKNIEFVFATLPAIDDDG